MPCRHVVAVFNNTDAVMFHCIWHKSYQLDYGREGNEGMTTIYNDILKDVTTPGVSYDKMETEFVVNGNYPFFTWRSDEELFRKMNMIVASEICGRPMRKQHPLDMIPHGMKIVTTSEIDNWFDDDKETLIGYDSVIRHSPAAKASAAATSTAQNPVCGVPVVYNPYMRKLAPTTPFFASTTVNPYKTGVTSAKRVQFVTPLLLEPNSENAKPVSTGEKQLKEAIAVNEPFHCYFMKWSKELQKDCPRLVETPKFKVMMEKWRNEALEEQEREKRGYDAITPSGIENGPNNNGMKDRMDFSMGAEERQRKACRLKWSFEK
jgi:hypothetical protein